ncbi:ferredoxin-NADP reductase/MOSC domain-containing protein YiiM [Luteibacter sp. W1I16]|uniref:MOSC domain-containing protein n=1 Tax=Luteibacter sp. W1I16 TaxID=3373922 RepID=UPI003D1CFE6F
MPVLLSVNVGLPQDIEWQGRTVRTAVFKQPVRGPVMARRLNLDGDGQGDLAGHGGEHRAIMVYQVQSYRYWETVLGRKLTGYGQFGENLTVDGLADDEVWIGDRYRIGGALLEVTQPRVTCYRVGIRLSEPRMPSLLVAHRRPGFYCRVIEEGTITEGDAIVLEMRGGGMSVAEVDALLYLPERSEEKLRQAVGLRGLSEGWRGSFEALLKAGPERNGNAGLASVPEAPPAWTGFRDVRVLSVHEESPRVRSFVFGAVDGTPLPPPRAGQFLVLKIDRPEGTPLLRSYSISDASHPGSYRISVKRAEGLGSAYLHDHVGTGSIVSISAPRGSFILPDDERPLVLWGVGIGVTPLLAMLHDIVARRDRFPRKIYWIYGTRDGSEHPFAQEARDLLRQIEGVTSLVAFSHPGPGDRLGTDFDVAGRLHAADLAPLGIPTEAIVFLCGPPSFMDESREGLRAMGFPSSAIRSELFGSNESLAPGVVKTATVAPHSPAGPSGTGPSVSFVRSGLSVRWDDRFQSLLELAEASDVPVRWSCRSGVCHSCESGLIGGQTRYSPDPLQPPADGAVLICCATPLTNLELDL